MIMSRIKFDGVVGVGFIAASVAGFEGFIEGFG
jgi:hypothetical protein